MATDGQRKEIFDKFKIVVSKIIFENGFSPDGGKGDDFYNKFIGLFNNFESPILKAGISSNKNKIIELYNHIYNNNKDDILQLAYAHGKDNKARTMNVMNFVIDKVAEIPRYSLIEDYWETYKRENPSGGKRRRFKTKKRKTKRRKTSKRNRKF